MAQSMAGNGFRKSVYHAQGGSTTDSRLSMYERAFAVTIMVTGSQLFFLGWNEC